MSREERIVSLNGKQMPESEARLPSDDPGFLFGMGAFETLVCYHGQTFAFPEHHDRLLQGGRILGLEVPSADELESEILGLLEANSFTEGRHRIRATLSGKTRLVSAVVCPEKPESLRVAVEEHPVNERSRLAPMKSSSYAEYALALRAAQAEGVDEALLINTAGFLCEASTSNVFVIWDGVIHTPSLESGCLPGVTRKVVMTALRDAGIEVVEGLFPVERLQDAEEIFLTSSMKEVCPISEVDGRSLELPGPMTPKAQELFAKLLPQV